MDASDVDRSLDPAGLLPRDFCPYARAFVRSFPPRQVVAIAGSCDAMRRAYDTLSYWKIADRVCFVDVPRTTDPGAVGYYAGELQRLASALREMGTEAATEDGCSRAPSEEDSLQGEDRLWLAIQLMDAIRRAMAQPIEAMRAGRMRASGVVRLALEINRILGAAGGDFTPERARDLACAVEEAIARDCRDQCDQRDGRDRRRRNQRDESARRARVPVGVSGTCLLDLTLLESLEDAGCDVVFVESCSLSRSFDFRVGDARESSGDPFLALARAYLAKPPCPRMYVGAARAEYLTAQALGSGARGIVYFAPKFCDIAYYDFPEARAALRGAGIPALLVEGEFGAGAMGQVVTRVTAFREMLEGR